MNGWVAKRWPPVVRVQNWGLALRRQRLSRTSETGRERERRKRTLTWVKNEKMDQHTGPAETGLDAQRCEGLACRTLFGGRKPAR